MMFNIVVRQILKLQICERVGRVPESSLVSLVALPTGSFTISELENWSIDIFQQHKTL